MIVKYFPIKDRVYNISKHKSSIYFFIFLVSNKGKTISEAQQGMINKKAVEFETPPLNFTLLSSGSIDLMYQT